MVSKELYTYILVVLGTNDIPKVKQWARQQNALQETMENVLAGLAGYLSSANLKGLLVTQVFSLEETRVVEKFTTRMEQVVTRAGARFVQVPWSKEHMQQL